MPLWLWSGLHDVYSSKCDQSGFRPTDHFKTIHKIQRFGFWQYDNSILLILTNWLISKVNVIYIVNTSEVTAELNRNGLGLILAYIKHILASYPFPLSAAELPKLSRQELLKYAKCTIFSAIGHVEYQLQLIRGNLAMHSLLRLNIQMTGCCTDPDVQVFHELSGLINSLRRPMWDGGFCFT